MLFQENTFSFQDLLADERGITINSEILLITGGTVFVTVLVIGLLIAAIHALGIRVAGDISGASWGG